MITSLARRRRTFHLLLAAFAAFAAFVATTVACADRRTDGPSDSVGAARARDPEAAFRARLGRTWELARLGEQELPPSPPRATPRTRGQHPGPGGRPTIRFTAEPETTLYPDSALSRAGGWSFCNGYGAGYKVGPGDQVRFQGFQSTLVGCDGRDSLETRFFRGLPLTRRFIIGADTLVLIAGDGSRLVFVAAPDSAGPP